METNPYDGAAGAAVGVMMFVYLALFVITVIGLWKVFEKAGKPGWAAIIPIYNIIVLLEIVGKPAWWVILFLIPIVGFIMWIIVANQLSISFGQGIGITILLIFLSFVGFMVIGFGSARYLGPGGVATAARPV
jgi:hypothetical protein